MENYGLEHTISLEDLVIMNIALVSLLKHMDVNYVISNKLLFGLSILSPVVSYENSVDSILFAFK